MFKEFEQKQQLAIQKTKFIQRIMQDKTIDAYDNYGKNYEQVSAVFNDLKKRRQSHQMKKIINDIYKQEIINKEDNLPDQIPDYLIKYMIHKIDVIHNDILIIPDYEAHEKIKQMIQQEISIIYNQMDDHNDIVQNRKYTFDEDIKEQDSSTEYSVENKFQNIKMITPQNEDIVELVEQYNQSKPQIKQVRADIKKFSPNKPLKQNEYMEHNLDVIKLQKFLKQQLTAQEQLDSMNNQISLIQQQIKMLDDIDDKIKPLNLLINKNLTSNQNLSKFQQRIELRDLNQSQTQYSKIAIKKPSRAQSSDGPRSVSQPQINQFQENKSITFQYKRKIIEKNNLVEIENNQSCHIKVTNLSLQQNKYPSVAIKSLHPKSIIQKYLSLQIFNVLKHKISSGPSKQTLVQLINNGINNTQDLIGIYPGDKEAIDEYKELVYSAIEDIHKVKVLHIIQNIQMEIVNIELEFSQFAKSRIQNINIRTHRNLQNCPLLMMQTEQQQLTTYETLKNAFQQLKGKFYKFSSATSEIVNLVNLKNDIKSSKIQNSKNKGVFLNSQKNVLSLINFEDHLEILSFQNGSDIQNVYQNLTDTLAQVSTQVGGFLTHQKFGYITTSLKKYGIGMIASFLIQIPFVIQTIGIDKIISISDGFDCEINYSKNIQPIKVIQVSNKKNLGPDVNKILNNLVLCVNYLLDYEQNYN